jgi:hypothetical protein
MHGATLKIVCYTCSGFYRFNGYRLLGLIPGKSREAGNRERGLFSVRGWKVPIMYLSE